MRRPSKPAIPQGVEAPVKLKILQGMTTVLKGIRRDQGYAFTIGDAVFRGRLQFGETDPDTMISIIEPPQPPEQQQLPGPGGTELTGPWDLVIQGFTLDDRDNPSDPAHYLLADIKRALALHRRANSRGERAYFGMPNTVLDIQVGTGVVRPPDELSTEAYCYLVVRLTVVEDTANPYAE